MRTGSFVCVCLLFATGLLPVARGEDLNDLQRQLAVAERQDPKDTAAVAEISRRILEIDPHDQSLWEKRVRALLDLGDLKRCAEALDAWEHQDKQIMAEATDIAGDLADTNDKPADALKFWTSYLKLVPANTNTYEKIAWLHERQGQWAEADGILTKLIAVEDSAGARVWRARCRAEMCRWDDAMADISKANKLDSSDDAVKQWLPQFELLGKSLPKIKALDRKIGTAKTPQPMLLLDRGLMLSLVDYPDLALQDAEAALAAVPGSKRAILQKARALVVLKRPEDAAKLRVIVANMNFDDAALQKIGTLDVQIATKPADAGLLTARARACSDAEQYGLALEDAQAAVKLAPKSADAMVELGFARMKLDDIKLARNDFAFATELDPKNAIAWRSLGEIAMDQADYPVAIDNFSRSLKLRESPLVLQKREQCYRNSGHNQEADQDLQRWQKLTAKPSSVSGATPHLNKK